MINSGATYRRDERHGFKVPVVLPAVEVNVEKSGHLTVTLDGEPYSAAGALQREDLQQVLAGIATDLGAPIRVDLREADDSTFTDIVTPTRELVQVVPKTQSQAHPVGEVGGDGFLPHETVAIAVVVAHQVASTQGTARLRLPPGLLEGHPGAVVLLGQESGIVTLSGSPS